MTGNKEEKAVKPNDTFDYDPAFYCGVCGQGVYWCQSHCLKCGTKIDWNDWEEFNILDDII